MIAQIYSQLYPISQNYAKIVTYTNRTLIILRIIEIILYAIFRFRKSIIEKIKHMGTNTITGILANQTSLLHLYNTNLILSQSHLQKIYYIINY